MQSVVVDIGTDITKKPKVRESLLSGEEDLPTETRKRGTETDVYRNQFSLCNLL